MEEMEAVEIAYLRRTGPYGPENRQLMERLKAFLKERDRMGSGTVLLGIALDDPSRTPAGPMAGMMWASSSERGSGSHWTPAGSGADGTPSLRSLIRSGRSPGSGKIWSA